MKILSASVGPLETNCYLAVDENTKEAVLLDPGAETAEEILRWIGSVGCRVTAILLTHGHFDHVLMLEALRETLAVPLILHREEEPLLHNGKANLFLPFAGLDPTFAPAEQTVAEGDRIPVGAASLTVLHTPGHTPGSVCFYDEESDSLFTGDTLFRCSIGRVDFPGGDAAAIRDSLAKLVRFCEGRPVSLYPGHGAPTDMLYEMKHNPYLT